MRAYLWLLLLGLGGCTEAMAYHATGPAWSPKNLSSTVCWLRSDVTATTNASGTFYVDTWYDLINSSNNATNGTIDTGSGNHPTLVTGGAGGQPKLHFPGSATMAWPCNTSTAFTATVVFTITTTNGAGNAGYSVFSMKQGGSDWSELLLQENSGGYQPVTYAGHFSSTTGHGYSFTLGTTTHVLSIACDTSGNCQVGSHWTSYVDWASQSDTTSAALARTSTDLGTIGSRQTSGGTVSRGFVGDLYEIIVNNVVLDATARQQMEWYLKNRYQL